MKKMSTILLKNKEGIEQGTGEMKGPWGEYCALGAISKGAGIEPKIGQLAPGKKLKAVFPCLDLNLTTKIIELNDDKGWSFKRIGNWLKERGL